MNIKIEYDGAYPNLCSGKLVVFVDGKRWEFPKYCLTSHGGVWFDDDWGEHIDLGEWSVDKWPDKFPDNLKTIVEREINECIPHGCCGGCL